VAVLLLCLGFSLALLSLPAKGSQDPFALEMFNMLPLDQVANGTAPPLDGIHHPFALAEEVETDPVNAGLLTLLLLVASFLRASLGWLLPNTQGQGALCFSSLAAAEVLGRARDGYLPFLGVFRL
jgi:hypothetical protein